MRPHSSGSSDMDKRNWSETQPPILKSRRIKWSYKI